MNICFFIYNISNSAGSERVTTLIANKLCEKGHNITILSLCGNNECYYELNSDIKLHSLYPEINEINYKIKYFSILKKTYSFFKKNMFDICIDVFSNISFFTIPIKKILNFKNITWEHFNFYSHGKKIKASRRLACKFSNMIITLTKEDVIAYRENLPKLKAKMDYIYNPSPFENVKKSNLDTKNVLTVGRLTYQKGYDTLLRAWKIVEEKNNEWKLIIVGTGEEEKNLKEQAKYLKLKNVKFMGSTKNVKKHYAESSIFVSTSRYEGLPMCMIEAQSFGLPIVAFNCKTGPSEIIVNNKTGFLIENQDISLMAEKIIELLNDNKKLKLFSKNIDTTKFSMNSIIEKWEKILKEF